ncbi:SDR family oxidoreductase [Bacillus velezensis]|nr:SDR family oxidoreductase [Bacillus velezensis]
MPAGASVFYEQTDVTDEAEVYRLIRNIRKRHGRLDGIVHSAGIIKNNYMVKKTAEEYQHVLAPKVKGLVYLDEASQQEKLDVFIVFSSLSGVLGSVGQADYASANVFMEMYAKYRRSLQAAGTKIRKDAFCQLAVMERRRNAGRKADGRYADAGGGNRTARHRCRHQGFISRLDERDSPDDGC